MKKLAFGGLAAMLMCSIGCGVADHLVADVQVLVVAAEAAAPFFSANPLVATYIGQAAQAAEAITAELSSKDTAAQKSTKVVADLVGIALPDLKDLPASKQVLVSAINAALQAVLRDFTSSSAHVLVAQVKMDPQFSKSDLKKLAELHARAKVVHDAVQH